MIGLNSYPHTGCICGYAGTGGRNSCFCSTAGMVPLMGGLGKSALGLLALTLPGLPPEPVLHAWVRATLHAHSLSVCIVVKHSSHLVIDFTALMKHMVLSVALITDQWVFPVMRAAWRRKAESYLSHAGQVHHQFGDHVWV